MHDMLLRAKICKNIRIIVSNYMQKYYLNYFIRGEKNVTGKSMLRVMFFRVHEEEKRKVQYM